MTSLDLHASASKTTWSPRRSASTASFSSSTSSSFVRGPGRVNVSSSPNVVHYTGSTSSNISKHPNTLSESFVASLSRFDSPDDLRNKGIVVSYEMVRSFLALLHDLHGLSSSMQFKISVRGRVSGCVCAGGGGVVTNEIEGV